MKKRPKSFSFKKLRKLLTFNFDYYFSRQNFSFFGIVDPIYFLKFVTRFLNDAFFQSRHKAGLSTLSFIRPNLSISKYLGKHGSHNTVPIYFYFDRVGGGKQYSASVTRKRMQDFRGGRLTYDDHDGTDFAVPIGTKILSAAPGIVVAFQNDFLRGGLGIFIDHGYGVVTQYCHLKKILVEIGQFIPRGHPIGLSGVSGIDLLIGFPLVPPHLHFGVTVNGKSTDPFLRDDEPTRTGSWMTRNQPSHPLTNQETIEKETDIFYPEVKSKITHYLKNCNYFSLKLAILQNRHDLGRLALIEDSVNHNQRFWHKSILSTPLRPQMTEAKLILLTLPIDSALYTTTKPYDLKWTMPTRFFYQKI